MKNWEMNATQKDFMDVLKGFGRPVTLMEIKVVTGKDFKTGSINTLIGKQLVKTEDVEVAYTEVKVFTFGDKSVEVKAEKTAMRKAYALA